MPPSLQFLIKHRWYCRELRDPVRLLSERGRRRTTRLAMLELGRRGGLFPPLATMIAVFLTLFQVPLAHLACLPVCYTISHIVRRHGKSVNLAGRSGSPDGDHPLAGGGGVGDGGLVTGDWCHSLQRWKEAREQHARSPSHGGWTAPVAKEQFCRGFWNVPGTRAKGQKKGSATCLILSACI